MEIPNGKWTRKNDYNRGDGQKTEQEVSKQQSTWKRWFPKILNEESSLVTRKFLETAD